MCITSIIDLNTDISPKRKTIYYLVKILEMTAISSHLIKKS